MMPWKKLILPAIIALAVPVLAIAQNPPPAPPPANGSASAANGNCPGGNCGTTTTGTYVGGHVGHTGPIRGLFHFLEDTNEAPEFRQHGGHFGHAGGLGGNGVANGGLGAFPNKMPIGAGYAANTAGHGLFQPPFQAAPWYLYWPYDSHFQLPAPINAAYYPPQAYGYPGMYNPYFGGSAPPGWPGLAPGMIQGAPGMPPGTPAPRIGSPEVVPEKK